MKYVLSIFRILEVRDWFTSHDVVYKNPVIQDIVLVSIT